MKAALFHGPGRPLEVCEVPDPAPGPGEALVRVAACGVCRTDLHYIDHAVPTFRPPPLILGHEASGTVEALGPDAAGPPPGTRVLVPAVVACGKCALCAAGRSNICTEMRMFGNHLDGAFAQRVRCPARELVVLPEGIPLEEACVVGDAVTTAWHAAVERGGVREGQTVAVFGCGGVGINVVQVCAARGARVLAVDVSAERLQAAKELGAAETVQAAEGRATGKEVRRLAGGGGVPVAFECVGHPDVLRQAHDALARGGRLVLVGYSERPAELAVSRIMFFEQELVGSLGCPSARFPEVLEMVRREEIRLAPLVTGRFPLEGINEALEALRRGEGFRNIVLMEEGR